MPRKMPRYFFHAPDDDEGTELPDDTAAREQARETFGQMIRDGSLPETGTMDVVDRAGRRVIRLSFSSEQ